MKRLNIVGADGMVLASSLVNVKGEDYQIKFNLPMFLPVVSISIDELSTEENEEITAQHELVRDIT